MDGFEIGMTIYRMFFVLVGVGIAALIYRKKMHDKSSKIENKIENKINNDPQSNNQAQAQNNIQTQAEKSPINMDVVQSSLRVVPVIVRFFSTPGIMLLTGVIGYLIFRSIIIAGILAIFSGLIMMFITVRDIKSIAGK